MDGCLYFGSKCKMMHKSHGSKPALIPLSLMEDFERPPRTIPRVDGHEQNWIDACKGGDPACSDFEYSGPMIKVVSLVHLTIRGNSPLLCDEP